MTAKEMLEKEGLTEYNQFEGYILKVHEIAKYMEDYAKLKIIEENKSIMAKLHMDERAIIVLKKRISELENQF